MSSQSHITINVRLFVLLPCPVTKRAALFNVTCNLSKYFLCVPCSICPKSDREILKFISIYD